MDKNNWRLLYLENDYQLKQLTKDYNKLVEENNNIKDGLNNLKDFKKILVEFKKYIDLKNEPIELSFLDQWMDHFIKDVDLINNILKGVKDE